MLQRFELCFVLLLQLYVCPSLQDLLCQSPVWVIPNPKHLQPPHYTTACTPIQAFLLKREQVHILAMQLHKTYALCSFYICLLLILARMNWHQALVGQTLCYNQIRCPSLCIYYQSETDPLLVWPNYSYLCNTQSSSCCIREIASYAQLVDNSLISIPILKDSTPWHKTNLYTIYFNKMGLNIITMPCIILELVLPPLLLLQTF